MTASPVRLLRLSAVLLVVGIALPLLAWSLPSMSVLAFLAGLPIAPVVMSAYGLIDAVAKRGTAAEAFAWITTAVFVGFSVGMALGRDADRCVRRPGVVRVRGRGDVGRRDPGRRSGRGSRRA